MEERWAGVPCLKYKLRVSKGETGSHLLSGDKVRELSKDREQWNGLSCPNRDRRSTCDINPPFRSYAQRKLKTKFGKKERPVKTSLVSRAGHRTSVLPCSSTSHSPGEGSLLAYRNGRTQKEAAWFPLLWLWKGLGLEIIKAIPWSK